MDSEDKLFLDISTLYARHMTVRYHLDELAAYSDYTKRIIAFEKQVEKNLDGFTRKKVVSIFDECTESIRTTGVAFLKQLKKENSNFGWRYQHLLREIGVYKSHRLIAKLLDRHQKGGKGEWITNWYLHEVSHYFKVGKKVRWKEMLNYLEKKRRYPPDLKKDVSCAVVIRRVSRFKKFIARK